MECKYLHYLILVNQQNQPNQSRKRMHTEIYQNAHCSLQMPKTTQRPSHRIYRAYIIG